MIVNQSTYSGETRQTQSREEEADAALRHTVVSRPVALALSFLFLVTIVSVPILQNVVEVRRNIQARKTNPNARILPQIYDVFGLFPSSARIRSMRTLPDAWRLLPPVRSIRDYENALGEHSVLTEWLLPQAQEALTGTFGIGNEEAYAGRGGWLYYRPDVDYLTGPPFLDSSVLLERARSGDSISAAAQPDPLKAIQLFRKQLAARGITLLVIPMPVKPVVEPGELSRRSLSDIPIQNPSFDQFKAALQRDAIPVFDPAPALSEARRNGSPQYLETDTHWTAAAMESTAGALASFIRARRLLPPQPPAGYTRGKKTVTNLGDIEVMLKLPAGQRLYRPQSQTIHPVAGPGSADWRPDPKSDVLLLGDSFSNIYSLSGMGWGSRAGFAEQLSFALQRPLDRIMINAGGAYSSRQALVQEMARGHDRLAGKRLVIYEFAVRDLSSGDWKLLNLPAMKGTSAAGTTPAPGRPTPPTGQAPPGKTALAGLVVRGVVKSAAAVPQPGSVPYKDCIIALRLSQVRALKGSVPAGDLLIYVWGMKDNKLVDGAQYTVGQTITLGLAPWDSVSDRYGGYNRRELDDPDALTLDAYWGSRDCLTPNP